MNAKPELNRLYRMDEMEPEWIREVLTGQFHQLPIPTEMVVLEARLVTPDMGRVWIHTGLHFWDGRVMEYSEVRDISIERTGTFGGSSVAASVYCTEVYHDTGDDGHIDYRLSGFRFLTDEDAGPKLEYVTWKRDDEYRRTVRPTGAMFEGWCDDDYERRWGHHE